jgi:hypothetical protein
LVAVLAATTVAACGGDSATSPTATNFAGTYTLRTVNGSNLPYVLLQNDTKTVTIMDDHITIADGGTWSEDGTLRVVTNGVTTTLVSSDDGTWVRSGNSIVLHSTTANLTAYSGTFTDTSLSLTDNVPESLVFRR